jgi:hypothetical protein
MYKVYKIIKIIKVDTGSNAYTTSREQTWEARLVREFDDVEAAKQYVIEKNINESDLMTHLNDVSDLREKSKDFLNEYSFGARYAHERVYHFGPPNKAVIEENGGVSAAHAPRNHPAHKRPTH